ncbi:espin-like [Gigantopelta aegis]|uniref:espin-like n=1 Tax=Gigantopelta aegis TaxID=1735272 RepID=UPI001B88B570|nr:espin-like [Gigantopelta aegis]
MSFASLRRVLRSARKGLCATCSKTRYPQLEAAGAGHVGCLIYTLETIGTLIKDDHEVTALHVAARKGQISVLIYLVENNVVKSGDVFKARNGATPAHDAAGTGNLECLRYLLSRTQAGPNDLDNNAATPLHWAAQSGHLKVVQWLVAEALAPVDAVAKNGVTPFHLAAAKNHLDVLRWLVGFAFRHHNQPMKLVNAKDKKLALLHCTMLLTPAILTLFTGHGAKLQRSKPTQGQMMDKYRHAPPHMTLHDLMDKEEIELLSQEQETFENDTIMTEAEQKRRRLKRNLLKRRQNEREKRRHL